MNFEKWLWPKIVTIQIFQTQRLYYFNSILVPGLLVSFCHAYDLQKGSRCWTYWALTNIFYMLGMIATFVSLFVMNSAQPALLYLVPFTLIPLFIVSCARGDFKDMWQGDFHVSIYWNLFVYIFAYTSSQFSVCPFHILLVIRVFTEKKNRCILYRLTDPGLSIL